MPDLELPDACFAGRSRRRCRSRQFHSYVVIAVESIHRALLLRIFTQLKMGRAAPAFITAQIIPPGFEQAATCVHVGECALPLPSLHRSVREPPPAHLQIE